MSRELESRNKMMYQMYVTGKSPQEIADTYGVSRQRVAQIVARYVNEGIVTEDEHRAMDVAQLEFLEQQMIAIVVRGPQPEYDVKGNMLVDHNGEPKWDWEHVIRAADQFRKVQDSKRRELARDLPRRKQITEDKAMEQVREYLASLPKAQVVDSKTAESNQDSEPASGETGQR